MAFMRYLVTILLIATLSEAAKWSYDPEDDNGPANWVDDTPTCGRDSQSPINIVTENTESVTYQPFSFTSSPSASLEDIVNNGHTVRMGAGGNYTLSGGGLETTYTALQAHFHWGVTNDEGSEHTVNGTQYPLELHMVHWAPSRFPGGLLNTSILDTLEPDALAVLGVLYEVGEDTSEVFNNIMDRLANLTYEGDMYDFQTIIPLYDLLPKNTTKFYRYDGSLTTPGCQEIVRWTVFAETNKVTQEQLDRFRALTAGSRNASYVIGNTYRPVQPVGSRTVYYNSALYCVMPSISTIAAMMVLLRLFINEQ